MPLATQQFFRTIDLTDTAINNPQDGEVLAYEASSGTWINATPAAGGSSTLSGLNDVTISSVANGEILVYDSGDWINQTLAEAGVAEASHTHAATDIVSGELNDDRLSSNVALYDQAGAFTQFMQFDDFNISGSGGRTGITSSATAGRTVSIGDFDGELVVLSDLTPASSEFLVRNGSGSYDSRLLVEADISDLGTYLEDLSALDTGDLAEGSNLYYTNERVDDRVNALLVAGSNISLTYDDGAGTLTIDATASGGSSTLSGLDDVTLSSLADGEVLVYDSGSSDWINQTLAEAGIAAASHTHAATDIVSGTFADARIAQSNVTQHEAALTITESQISDLGSYLSDITSESVGDLSDVTITSLSSGEVLVYNGSAWVNLTFAEAQISQDGHTHAATDIVSGTFADARISESSVTQHEAALSITESQISDLGSYLTGITGENFGDLSDVTISSVTNGEILVYDSGDWINQTLAEAGIASATHTHAASDVTSGTFADARIAESNVTQHEAALTITESQISDLGSYITGITGENFGDLSDVTITSVANGEVLVYDSGDWINQTLAEAGIAAASHTHSTSNITSGVLPVGRGGTGFGALPSVSNYTPTNSNYTGHLAGIDNALGNKIEDLSSFDTGDLSEGSNLYFTNERVDDRVNALLVEGSNITLTYDDGAGTLTIDAAGGGGSSTLSGLSDVTISSVGDGEILVYDSGSSDWINQTLAEAGIAAISHTHAATDITSGTFADGRISESSVTQHESALTITESQISDLGSYYESGDTILAADGTLANPGLSFSNHDNFGLYMQSSSRMDLVANGTSVARLSNNGIFSTAIFQAEVTQFQASISWVASSTNSIFNNTTTSTGAKITLREGTANGTNGISLTAPNSLASNVSFEVPSADGDDGQALTTDGSGTLSFRGSSTLINLSYTIPEPEADSYVLCRSLPSTGGSLDSITYATDSGTCDIDITIDGTSVTSWSSLSVNSSESTTASTGNETFSGGEVLRVVVSNISSPDMLSITIEGELD